MAARKTLDIDADVDAMLAKVERLRVDQQMRLGALVLETGAHKIFSADELKAGLLGLVQSAGDVTAQRASRATDTPAVRANGHAGSSRLGDLGLAVSASAESL